jgi:hypothetical protein
VQLSTVFWLLGPFRRRVRARCWAGRHR